MKRALVFGAVCAVLIFAQESPELRQAVENYKRSWQRMSEKQRKMMLERGGYTPEAYEQMLRRAYAGSSPGNSRNSAAVETSAPPKPAEGAATPKVDVFDSMRSSTEDLNLIRDANLKRVESNGCAPEVAARIADLKSRLSLGNSSKSIADRWFDPEQKPTTPAVDTAAAKNSELDAVLGIAAPAKPAAKNDDASQMQAELRRLTTLCGEGR